MFEFKQRTAVITGAGSGFGREFALMGASLGMNLVLADVQTEALAQTEQMASALGAQVLARKTDVANAEQVQALADAAFERFKGVHLLFNNAGVATGGLVWEQSLADWQWVMGVNVMGVVHGIKAFVPRMLAQAERSHIVNTASVAGLLSAQTMAVYNVSKHAVVTLSESLFQDLRITQANIGVTVLCPAFVPTGIHQSERNRPQDLRNEAPPTESMRAAQEASTKAVTSGKLTARQVAEMTFDAIRENRFYLITHPKILKSVELRMQDVLSQRNPSDPFAFKKDVAFTMPKD
jgi:NAD(P)-dependent dehydrogenase (short-subunit alcohol dehydrogenase family)